MGNERHDGQVISGHGFDGCQEFLCFGRRQRRSRFVQDEDPGSTIEGLQDLDHLLFSFRKLPYFGPQVDLEAVSLAELLYLFCRSLQVENGPRPWVPEDDVFHHRVRRHQFAVLMNHPNPQIDGVKRRSELDRLPPDIDLTLVGLIQPEQDIHQGGLPGAIFSKDCMDLTSLHVEIDTVVGDDPWESLGDPTGLQDGLSVLCSLQEPVVHLSLFPGFPQECSAFKASMGLSANRNGA